VVQEAILQHMRGLYGIISHNLLFHASKGIGEKNEVFLSFR
jgi:hypothetical protein